MLMLKKLRFQLLQGSRVFLSCTCSSSDVKESPFNLQPMFAHCPFHTIRTVCLQQWRDFAASLQEGNIPEH